MGSNWNAMLEILRHKFHPRSKLSEALRKTGDAYLVEHNSQPGRDNIWSDNHVGDGTNWLGMQLMIVRDDLREKNGSAPTWTPYIRSYIDLSSGQPHDHQAGH